MAAAENFPAMRQMVRNALPPEVRRWIKRRIRFNVGIGRFASLRTLRPVSRHFGFDRGKPVDRYYIEGFLAANARDVHGSVLEIGDNAYTRRFGSGVEKSEVLHAEDGHPGVTIVADLAHGDTIRSDSFDCAIITQTVQLIYDIRSAVGTIFRILKPGGVALVTFPGISQIARPEMERFGDCWRLTTFSARKLFEEFFPSQAVTVASHGNVLAAVAFLHGIAREELTTRELDYCDPDYQLLVAVRAQKPL